MIKYKKSLCIFEKVSKDNISYQEFKFKKWNFFDFKAIIFIFYLLIYDLNCSIFIWNPLHN